MIYFIRCEMPNSIKIGMARKSVTRRLNDLQIGCPSKLTLIDAIPGWSDLESRLHKIFRAQKLRGEWFSNDGHLAKFLARLIECGDVKSKMLLIDEYEIALSPIKVCFDASSEREILLSSLTAFIAKHGPETFMAVSGLGHQATRLVDVGKMSVGAKAFNRLFGFDPEAFKDVFGCSIKRRLAA